jgi:hypothetical protein
MTGLFEKGARVVKAEQTGNDGKGRRVPLHNKVVSSVIDEP